MLEWVQCHPRAAVLGRASRPVPSHLHATQTAALHSDSSLMELRGERVKGQFRGGFEVKSSKSQSQSVVCWITFYHSVVPSIILAFFVLFFLFFFVVITIILLFFVIISIFISIILPVVLYIVLSIIPSIDLSIIVFIVLYVVPSFVLLFFLSFF